jgi:hypothetical protein
MFLGFAAFYEESWAEFAKTNICESAACQCQPHPALGLERFGAPETGEGSPEKIEEHLLNAEMPAAAQASLAVAIRPSTLSSGQRRVPLI